jgi:hypothetical protein
MDDGADAADLRRLGSPRVGTGAATAGIRPVCAALALRSFQPVSPASDS